MYQNSQNTGRPPFQKPQYPRDDRRQSGPRDYNQRPPYQGDRPPRQNNGYQKRPYGQRPNDGRPPRKSFQGKLPGKGNPKQNYLKIKPGATFVLMGNKLQVKLLASDSYEELQFAINEWLADPKHTSYEIVDIKYTAAAYYGCSCCIMYRPSIEVETTITYEPKNIKAPEEKPAESQASSADDNTGGNPA